MDYLYKVLDILKPVKHKCDERSILYDE